MKKWIPLAILIGMMVFVLAGDFTPQGDINLRNLYKIKNWNISSCGGGYIVKGIYANGSWECVSATSGSGDITAVLTPGNYLYGGCTSGDCSLYVNETYLNSTIDARDDDTTYTHLSNFTNDLGIGNWTADKSSYYTKTNIDAFSLSHWTDDLGDRGYNNNLNFTNGAGYWNDTFATFNESYADTKYLLLDASNGPIIGNLTIDGWLGVGTTNPKSIVDVVGSGSDSFTVLYRNEKTGAGTQSAGFRLRAENYQYVDFEDTTPIVYSRIRSDSNNKLSFWTYDGSLQERMVIDKTGKVGIGMSPTTIFSVNGSATFGDPGQPIYLYSSGASNYIEADYQNLIFKVLRDVDNIYFFVNGSDNVMTVTGDKKVGIGTSSPGEKLQVIGRINASSDVCITGGNCLSDALISYTETDPLWTSNQSLYYTKTNIDSFSLSHWTDDLGDRGYTSLSNFTDDVGFVNEAGDTMTGNLGMSNKNITNVQCITFNSGGSICSA